MRALVVREFRGPDGAAPGEMPDPVPAEAAVGPRLLVEVHAAGVAFRDVLMTQGRYQRRPELPFVPGGEVAGVVREAPPGSRFGPGDRVAAVVGDSGGMAELALGIPEFTLRLPDAMSHVAGAAVVINYTTAWFALDLCRIAPDDTVLIQGAAGGVGTATIEVATGLGGRTIAVVSSDDKERVVRRLGVAHVVRSDGPWREQVYELTDGRGVDVVVDTVGGDRFTDSVRSMAVGGRLAVVGFAGGSIPEVKVNRLLLRNTSIIGVDLGVYSRSYPEAGVRVMEAVERMLERGAVNPVIGALVSLTDGAEALRIVRDRRVIGKAVVGVRPDDGS